jgi:hypothetical protein
LIIAVKARTTAIISNKVPAVPLIRSRKYSTAIAAAITNLMILSADPKLAFIQNSFDELQNC